LFNNDFLAVIFPIPILLFWIIGRAGLFLSLLSGSDGYLDFSSGSLFGLLLTLSSLESVPLSLQVSTPYLDFDLSLPGLDFAAAAGSRSPFYSPEP
jgi:hypothetical protein